MKHLINYIENIVIKLSKVEQMNEEIIKKISQDLKINVPQIDAFIQLLNEHNTIPFIARYRKEMTKGLDEEQIKKIAEYYQYQQNLLARKATVINLIAEKDLLTDELKNKILNAQKLVEVEDLYRPFKEKKKTKATEAIKKGLEPLAKLLMTFPEIDLPKEAEKYCNKDVKTSSDAIVGAGHIIAEWISDNATHRKWLRNYLQRNGVLYSKKKQNAVDEKKVYEIYYQFTANIKDLKPHQILAINRGERAKILQVKIAHHDDLLSYLNKQVIKNENSPVATYVADFISDSYYRLIMPSLEREIRSDLTAEAEVVAINNFGYNLEKLLLTPPLKEKQVLAIDPAYRTGCKIAVLDKLGNCQTVDVIYPHPPQNEWTKSKDKLLELIQKYQIDVIAIGNGTASRESEKLVAQLIQANNLAVAYIIVNEAGASVYSASSLAQAEFPKLSVEQRSAISIGRRLQDPLAELVKIDPKSIGVGLYQHDVTQKLLNERLTFIITKVVNMVGVNVNTASFSLLQYIAGLDKRLITKIMNYRQNNGMIKSRAELAKILTPKSYQQAVGFLRVLNSPNILDRTAIHPESYEVTFALLTEINSNVNMIGMTELEEILAKINLTAMSEKLAVDEFTLIDIIKSLQKPNRDPRDEMPQPLLKSNILTIEDLKIGMELQGTIRNVVDFGAFVDIGLKNDGLIHISQMSEKYLKHPNELLAIGDIVVCKVIDINIAKARVSLSLI